MNRKDFIKKATLLGGVLVAGDTIANGLTSEINGKTMKKKIKYKTNGHRADIGPFKITRLVSNSYVDHVGHFVFLDQIHPTELKEKRLNPEAAHPHRGIATLTYVVSGEIEHFDSRQHKAIVHSGGVQWMNAGNGIIHNESVAPDSKKAGDNTLRGFQFWINLPGEEKKKNPSYKAVQSNELPVLQLQNEAGTLKVVVGEYKGQTSTIPLYSKQYLYHIHLKPGKKFELTAEDGDEYACFPIQHNITINDELCEAGYLVGFDDKAGSIEFINQSEKEVELILFGGEKYTEPYVAYGPFVMNTKEEIEQAYADYQSGKYGKMVYS